MCKIFAMTNMDKVKLDAKFVNTVKNEVCRLSDKDGFGYAVLGAKGELGGERTIRPQNYSALKDKVFTVTGQLPIVLKTSNVFGKIDLHTPKAFIAHGRFSTNEKTLDNTHPFTNGEVALIHNGVVDDADDYLDNLTSTCDSEILLRYWEIGGMKSIEESVTGYYAMAILDKRGRLHIARDDRAMLYLSYCRTVDSYIIATTTDIIKNVAKKMKWKIEAPEEMLPNMYAIFEKNDIISHEKISPRQEEYGKWNSMDSKAKGAFGGNDYASATENAKSLVHIESDPEVEDAPGYREAMDKDSYSSRYTDDGMPDRFTEEEMDTVTYMDGYTKTRRNIS